MSHIKGLRNVYLTLLIGAVIIVVGAILVNQIRYARDQQAEVSPAPSVTVSPSPTSVESVVQPVDLASPTPSVPAATATTVALPQSVNTFLANFYAAYNQQDRTRLAAYFTADTTDADKNSHAHLFTNMDTVGTVGGPYLFVDAAVSEHASGYSIINGSSVGSNWVVTLLEQRVASSGETVNPVTTLITLVPSTNPAGSWLVDTYLYSGGVGKYSAFFNQ